MSSVVTPVLSDLLPRTRARDVALTLGGTLFLVLASQVLIPLGFTPVPLSLATFAVLLIGAGLGPVRGGAAAGIYVLIGIGGAPVFAGHASGVGAASFGYAMGYILAAIAVGLMARKSADRKMATTLVAGIVASVIIYACGVPWFMLTTGAGLRESIALGVVPFLAGDFIKALAVSAILPAAWKLAGSQK